VLSALAGSRGVLLNGHEYWMDIIDRLLFVTEIQLLGYSFFICCKIEVETYFVWPMG